MMKKRLSETEVQALVSSAVGQTVWGVKLGYGTFVTAELGKALPPAKTGLPSHGEWHLWVHDAAWRVELNDGTLAGSEDPERSMTSVVGGLDGGVLEAVVIVPPTFDALFVFSTGLLRTFAVKRSTPRNWMFFLPNGRVIEAGTTKVSLHSAT